MDLIYNIFIYLVILFCRSTNQVEEYYQLMEAGADSVCVLEREASFKMFSSLLSSLNLIPTTKVPSNVPLTMSPAAVIASTQSQSLPVLADWNTAPIEDEDVLVSLTKQQQSMDLATNSTGFSTGISMSSTSLPFHENLVNQFRQRAVDKDEARMKLKSSERTGWAADG